MTTQAISSAKHAVLNKGQNHLLLSGILEMTGDPQLVQIARVNKAFSAAFQKLQSRVCAQLSLVSSVAVLGALPEEGNSCAGEFNRAWEELEKAVAGLEEQMTQLLPGVADNRRAGYQAYWMRLVDLKRSIEEETVIAVKEKRMQRLLAHFPAIHEQIAEMNRQYANALDVAVNELRRMLKRLKDGPDHEDPDPIPKFLKALEECVVCENVMLRFRAIVSTGSLNFETDPARCLGELHKKQKSAVSSDREKRENFGKVAETHPFSASRFIAQEKIASRAEVGRQSDLYFLWRETLGELGRQGFEPVENLPDTLEAVKSWFERKENETYLAKVELLTLQGMQEVPAQLEKFSHLRKLSLHGNDYGRISFLPPWFRNLSSLRELSLNWNDFTEVPPEVKELRLEKLAIWKNKITHIPLFLNDLGIGSVNLEGNPIREFSDEIYRTHEGFLGDDRIQIDTEKLNKMPFRLWFKENFTLPLPQLIYPSEHLRAPMPSPWYGLLYCGFLCLNFALLLTPVIFVYNWIVMNVVERLFTLGRDLLGRSRMVDVEPVE